MSEHTKKHSLIGKISLILILLVLLAATVLFFLYKTDTPLTEYVDYQLAYRYERNGEFEKAIAYYEKINTEQSLEYRDDVLLKLARQRLENGNYLGAYKAYGSLNKMTRTVREQIEKVISADDFLNGLSEQLNDPSLSPEDLPEYIPVRITTENFNDFFHFSQTVKLNIETFECTTFYLHLNEEFQDSFDYDNEFNYLNFDYLYWEKDYAIYDRDQLGGLLRQWDTPFTYRYRNQIPSLHLRAFNESREKGSLGEIKISASFGYSNGAAYPDEATVPEDIYILEADGLMFFKTELFR